MIKHDQRIKNCMVLFHLFDESRTRLADFGYILECKSKNLKGLNEISLPLARMGSYLIRGACTVEFSELVSTCSV